MQRLGLEEWLGAKARIVGDGNIVGDQLPERTEKLKFPKVTLRPRASESCVSSVERKVLALTNSGTRRTASNTKIATATRTLISGCFFTEDTSPEIRCGRLPMGGRFVVVEGGDVFGIAFSDHAPAQFQRGCQLTGIHRPLVGNQVETLDGLEIRQALVNAVDESMVLRLHRRNLDQIGASRRGNPAAAPNLQRGKFGRSARIRLCRSPANTALGISTLAFSWLSIGWGAIILPPEVLIRSFCGRNVEKSFRVLGAISPVWNHPSLSMAWAVASGLRQ